MSYPMRRNDHASEDPRQARPVGPLLVEDEPTLATAPSGARVPPRRLPPGISGTDFDSAPPPSSRPFIPVPRRAMPIGHYLSFLPLPVAAVYLVLMLMAICGFLAVRAWGP